MAKKDAVAVKEDATMAPIEDMEADAGEGMELIGVNDLVVPLFVILQALSPQCDKTKDEYMDGAEQGNFYLKSKEVLYDGEKGVDVIPCFYDKKIFEWGPNRGGLKGVHPLDTPLMRQTSTDNEKGIPTLGNGNTLVETAQYYCLLVDGDKIEPIVIGMYSTALKKSRAWNSAIKNLEVRRADKTTFNPPIYSHIYTVKTVIERKDDNSWYNWDINVKEIISNKNLYDAAKSIYHMAIKGNVEVQADAGESIPF